MTPDEYIAHFKTIDPNRGLPRPNRKARRAFPLYDGHPILWAGHIGLLTEGEVNERYDLNHLYATAFFKAVNDRSSATEAVA